jgi:zinc finger CCHC domain-containing protein 9
MEDMSSTKKHPPRGAGGGRGGGRPNKPKMTKEERRAKYTAKAHARRDAAMARSRDRDLTCYRCRKTGHSSENCKYAPESSKKMTTGKDDDDDDDDDDERNGGGEGGGGMDGGTTAPPTPQHAGRKRKKGGNICYKCGSTEHRIQLCPRIKSFLQKMGGKNAKRIDYGKLGDLPFADCYFCNASGHLASYCPMSDKGLYPRGGSCRECRSVDHLAVDCPEKKNGMEENEGKGGLSDNDANSVESSNSVTIDRYLEETADAEDEKKTISKKKRRIVKF